MPDKVMEGGLPYTHTSWQIGEGGSAECGQSLPKGEENGTCHQPKYSDTHSLGYKFFDCMLLFKKKIISLLLSRIRKNFTEKFI